MTRAPKPGRRRLLRWLVIFAGVYLALCGIGRLVYPKLLFPAPKLSAPPAYANGAGEPLHLAQGDGSKTDALWLLGPGGDKAKTVVFFHGNGETMFHNLDIARELNKRGINVLLVEYRGYGTTHGPPPTEAMLYEDGEAAISWLEREKHVSLDRIVLCGFSLGTGVAAELAARGHAAKLILLAPYTSIDDMALRVAPILPASVILSHHLDTFGKAKRISVPTLVVHGDEDEVVPFEQGERLGRAIPNAKFVRVKAGHHTDLLYVGPGSPNAAELYEIITRHVHE